MVVDELDVGVDAEADREGVEGQVEVEGDVCEGGDGEVVDSVVVGILIRHPSNLKCQIHIQTQIIICSLIIKTRLIQCASQLHALLRSRFLEIIRKYFIYHFNKSSQIFEVFGFCKDFDKVGDIEMGF